MVKCRSDNNDHYHPREWIFTIIGVVAKKIVDALTMFD